VRTVQRQGQDPIASFCQEFGFGHWDEIVDESTVRERFSIRTSSQLRAWHPHSRMCTFRKSIHMRTNIVIDDKLMAATLKATGLKTKREAVEQGLRALLRLKQQTELRKLRGKYVWEGDLDAMRRDK
jgi:Arc/MetJ family transcription regulator